MEDSIYDISTSVYNDFYRGIFIKRTVDRHCVCKKDKNVGDFYLGGRKLGPIVTAMSAEASDMSSYLLMGLPGLAYLSGCAEVGWTVIGLAVGTYLNWLIVAKNFVTIPHTSVQSQFLTIFIEIQGRQENSYGSCSVNYHHFLRSLHSFGLQRLRQTLWHIVWNRLPHCNGCVGNHHCRLHITRRI